MQRGSDPFFVDESGNLLKARQKLGKYRILGRIASGPLADVYRAADTIHRTTVALKIPKSHQNVDQDDYIHEVQIAMRLRHPNILTIQDASIIDDKFVIAMELGMESLADRIQRRMSTVLAYALAEQALAALAYAHDKKIIHCDIKPENFILFQGNRLKLTDFGFAKISLRTLKASGSGTIDYIAPEQAMGRPKFQSDVFSLGLVLYRMFSGKLPEWPFKWPMVGYERLLSRTSPDFANILQKAIQLDPADRYRSATEMYADFRKVRRYAANTRRRKARKKRVQSNEASWRKIQWREFQRQFRKTLDTTHYCRRCEGPVAETMQVCPWCGTEHPTHRAETSMPAICPRCERGVKNDWNYCAWCYGTGFEVETHRHYPDKRYSATCSNHSCRQPLMPFMRYCPWCRSKVRKTWKIEGSSHRCTSCGWGIVREFWDYCPWCRAPVEK